MAAGAVYSRGCPVKSYIRKTKASGSTLHRIAVMLRRGWYRKPRPHFVTFNQKGGK